MSDALTKANFRAACDASVRQECPPLPRVRALGTSRAWLTAGCGTQWLASSMYLLTCRWNSLRYCGLFPVPLVSLMWNAWSVPTPWSSHCGCGCLTKCLEKPSRSDLTCKTGASVGDGNEHLLGGPTQAFAWTQLPPLCPTHLSFPSLPQQLLFMVLIPFASLSLFHSLWTWSTTLSDLSNVCMSLIHISLLSQPLLPLLPISAFPSHSPSLWQDELESLRAFIRTNKCSVCGSWLPLSMATHEGEHQDTFQAD